MPLRYFVSDLDSEIVLDKIDLIKNDGDLSYYHVYNENGKGINIRYTPLSFSTWDKEEYDIYFFENSYLNAENDVFEIYEETLNTERLGWIFPLTILDSNNNNFSDFKNLNNYKFVAYEKLISLDHRIPSNVSITDLVSLSDIFGDLIICVLCKKTMKKIVDFNINDYILSFYKYGYLKFEMDTKSKIIYTRSEFVSKMRSGRSRVKIKKSNYDIFNNDYTTLLFKDHLLQSDNHIIRFIFLYQIIEFFIQEEFDNQFQIHFDDYSNNKISKNDLRENIITCSKERELIKIILNRIKIDQELANDFMQECSYLFADLDLHQKNSLSDKIYDFRNLIVHRLRDLTAKTDLLIKITDLFEQLLVNILINFSRKSISALQSAEDSNIITTSPD